MSRAGRASILVVVALALGCRAASNSSAGDAGFGDAGGTGDGGGVGADAGPTLRFVAVGDTGNGDAYQAQVAAAIAARCDAGGCDFVQLLGDNIYYSGVTSTTDTQWQTKFETPYAGINLPFYAVLGNHDYGGNGVGNEFWKAQIEVDYSAVSAKWRMPAKYWRRTEGKVEFFALDTNAQMYYDAGLGAEYAAQRADVAAWLADSGATWKIAVGHHPYLSNGPHGNAGSYDGLPATPETYAQGVGVKNFMDGVVCGKADLYISGHDHSRQWIIATCQGTELAVSGAGASLTALTTVNATRHQSMTLGFLYVTIQGNTLTAEFVNTSGVTDFTRTLTK